jgi:hypothetical protein
MQEMNKQTHHFKMCMGRIRAQFTQRAAGDKEDASSDVMPEAVSGRDKEASKLPVLCICLFYKTCVLKIASKYVLLKWF